MEYSLILLGFQLGRFQRCQLESNESDVGILLSLSTPRPQEAMGLSLTNQHKSISQQKASQPFEGQHFSLSLRLPLRLSLWSLERFSGFPGVESLHKSFVPPGRGLTQPNPVKGLVLPNLVPHPGLLELRLFGGHFAKDGLELLSLGSHRGSVVSSLR
jgi:hypothetical protein